MNDDVKAWLGFAVLIAGVAAVLATISVLFVGYEGLSIILSYSAVALAAVSVSAVGGALLYPKWKNAPVVWYLVHFFLILPACVAISLILLDSFVGQ